MKVYELIEELKKIPNQNAEVKVQHWLLAKKSDKVIINITSAKEILRRLDGNVDEVVIDTEQFKENI